MSQISDVVLCPAERNELWLFSKVRQQYSPPQFPTIAHSGTNIHGMWPRLSSTCEELLLLQVLPLM